MVHEFTTELTSQEEWSWLVAIDLFLGGLGGSLFLLFLVLDLPPFIALLSLGFVLLGGLVLLAELGHPLRAWRAICRPRTSWISRGVIFVLVFLISAALYIAPALGPFSALPWSSASLGGKAIGAIAGLSAFLVTLYPGFVLSFSPSIPFWNSPLLPVLFFSHSVLAAMGIALLLFPGVPGIASLAAAIIIANLIMVAIYLLTLKRSGLAARDAVRRLNEGPLGRTFWIGVIFVGMIIPLAAVLAGPAATVLAGVTMVIGALLFRYCVLKAGVYVPFPLT
jgi:formate-dependent nitrite reductase membrane component NrfD